MTDNEELKELLETLLGKITHLEEKLKKTLLLMAKKLAEISVACVTEAVIEE